MASLLVATLAFPGISAFHLSIPCTVFGEDRTKLGLPRFDFRVCGEQQGAIRTSAGLSVLLEHDLSVAERADILVVPSWRAAATRPDPALVETVRRAEARGATIIGLCLGAFVLAESGVLDGRSATTHWAATELLASRYSRIDVQPNVLYVDEGRIVTSAGVAAGLDCCLHIVRRDYGAEIAARLARTLVVAPHRLGGQAQFLERPLPQSQTDARLAAAIEAVRRNASAPHDLDSVAALAQMSRRTFTRRFHAATGASFSQWLLEERLTLARRLLETTHHGIDAVAMQAGFANAVSLRQHFAARLGTTPVRYRREFSTSAAG